MPQVNRLLGLTAMKTGWYQWPNRATWANLYEQIGPQVAIHGWFRNNELLYTQVTDKHRIYTFNVETLVPRLWPGGGPNAIFGGGGVWSSYGENQYVDSWGPNERWDQREWRPLAVDNLTGQIVFTRNNMNQDLCVYQGHEDPSQATLTTLITSIASQFKAEWWDGILTIWFQGHWYRWKRGEPTLTEKGTIAREAMFPEARWSSNYNLGHSGPYAQVVWPDWTPREAIGVCAVDNFNAKIWRDTQNSNLIDVIGSARAGEGFPWEDPSTDYRKYTVDLAAQTVNGVPWQIFDVVEPGPFLPPMPLPPVVVEGGSTPQEDSAQPRVGTIILQSSGTFEVVAAAEEVVELPIEVYPSYPVESGHGRIVHPTLGAFDYETKPDEWVNVDADAIIAPVWSSTRTLTSAANVLWKGNIRDVIVEERWKALGGLAMPITQLRMLLAIWTTPVDPDVGYVHWYPNYITQVGFKVIPMMLASGGQGITFDDVVNYKDEYGDPIGWMTNPVTLTLKMVERL